MSACLAYPIQSDDKVLYQDFLSARESAPRDCGLGQEAANDDQGLPIECTQERPLHMGGRIYDPNIARFLSADPIIQAPKNLQNYNRYSYVLNNPLKYTDPSGYFFKRVKKWWKRTWNSAKRNSRAITAAVLTIATAGAYMAYAMAAGPLTQAAFLSAKITAGVAGGFVGGAVGTGTAKGAITGGLTGGMFGGLHAWQPGCLACSNGLAKATAHGTVGGINSVMNGGEFRYGFASAGLTQASSLSGGIDKFANSFPHPTLGNAAAASLIGGIGARAAGGDFAYGARIGVYSRFLNDGIGKVIQYIGADGKTYTVRVRQSAEGYLAEQAGAESIASYETTTRQEVGTAITAASVVTGVGAIATGSTALAATALSTSITAAAVDPSASNVVGASVGVLTKVHEPVYGPIMTNVVDTINDVYQSYVIIRDD